MSDGGKFPIDPAQLASVRDQAMVAAKRGSDNRYVALAAMADEVLQSYKSTPEVRELQRRKHKITVT